MHQWCIVPANDQNCKCLQVPRQTIRKRGIENTQWIITKSPSVVWLFIGPLTRHVKLWVAHAPGIGNVFPTHRLQRKPRVNDPGRHDGTCVTHVPWCMSGSLTRGGAFPACTTRNFTYPERGPYQVHLPNLKSVLWIVCGKPWKKCDGPSNRSIKEQTDGQGFHILHCHTP